jgi:hypothetical protein
VQHRQAPRRFCSASLLRLEADQALPSS